MVFQVSDVSEIRPTLITSEEDLGTLEWILTPWIYNLLTQIYLTSPFWWCNLQENNLMTMKNNTLIKNNRREFLKKTFSSCAFCCFASPILFGSDKKLHPIASNQQHKFQSDSGMSFQEVFDFAYKKNYIPAMKNLMSQIGHEEFIELLKKSSDKMSETNDKSEIDYSKRTLKEWIKIMKKECQDLKCQISCEILKEDDHEFEILYTECLWAKTFLEADASEIGYAGMCYSEFGKTKAFNPNLKIIFDKSLMNGDDRCHFKWFMEI